MWKIITKISPGQNRSAVLKSEQAICSHIWFVDGGYWRVVYIVWRRGRIGYYFYDIRNIFGGIVGIFLLGLFSARANRQGVNIGIITCILFTAYAFLTSTPIGLKEPKLLLDLGSYNFTHNKLMLGVYSHLVLIGVGYTASLFFPKPDIAPNLLFSNWKKNRKLDAIEK
ncbi:hypothetical protein [Niabella hibiscisoli]|uniref:hypothetical protein n=1 Tax=Niabella hibiscisoli TaxID=1825928 RepID=UPI001F0E8F5D|nr:hypothetical protein [Niabella hibiscisoli]MCH5720195.1 hypothetical protein [Niabella hibiscisoli]